MSQRSGFHFPHRRKDAQALTLTLSLRGEGFHSFLTPDLLRDLYDPA
jgi:hypothetical protein